MKARFEEFYAEESFEDGKKGVQVLIDNNQYTGFNFINNLSESYNSVFFTENVMYYDFVNKGLFEDITTEMTTPLTEYGDERSIEDKMYGGYIDYYKTDDGKYYELPFYEAYPTIAYDIELYETRNYYFAKGGAPSEFCEFTQSNNTDKATGEFSGYKYVGAIGARSAGPDGKYGTNDDGLPATYDKFLRCARKYRGIT